MGGQVGKEEPPIPHSALPDSKGSDIAKDCKRACASFKGLSWTWLPRSCGREKAGSRQGNNSVEFNYSASVELSELLK